MEYIDVEKEVDKNYLNINHKYSSSLDILAVVERTKKYHGVKEHCERQLNYQCFRQFFYLCGNNISWVGGNELFWHALTHLLVFLVTVII